MSPTTADELDLAGFNRLRTVFPEAVDLIDGMARVSGERVERVAAANLWPLLMDACSCLALRHAGGTVLAQNLDLGVSFATAPAVIKPRGGIPFVAHMNPGTAWFTTGVNAHGVAVGGASVNAEPQSSNASGFYSAFVHMLVLTRATRAQDAEAIIRSAAPFSPSADGAALICADKNAVLRIEVSGREVSCRPCDAAIATNCFVDLEHMSASGEAAKCISESARQRALRAKSAPIGDTASLRSFLRAEEGRGAWCRTSRYPDVGWTTASYVFDLPHDEIWFCNDPAPLEPRWRSNTISGLLN